MKKVFTVLALLLLTFPNISLGEEVEILERKSFDNLMYVTTICVSGYKFVMICKQNGKRCNSSTQSQYFPQQLIDENGNGIKC